MRKGLKIILYIIGCVLLVLILCVVYLNTPSGQGFVRGKAEAYLNKKLKTTVRIGRLGYGLPKFIVLDDVLVLDQAQDTLLVIGKLKIDLNMLQLLHKDISVQQVNLSGVHAHIYRNMPDTAFNFTYIINAFAGNKPEGPSKIKDTTKSSLKIEVDRVKLDDIHFRFDDQTGGSAFAVHLEHLDLKMKKLDLDKMMFHIKDLSVSGLQSSFAQDSSYLPKHPHDTTETKLQIIADNVDLQQISFGYNNALNKILLAVKLGGAQLQLNKFVLEDNLVDVKKLAINNTDIGLDIGKSATNPGIVDTIVRIDTTEGWIVKAGDVNLSALKFRMDNENEPRQLKGMDYYHLNGDDIMLELHNLAYTSDSISGIVKHLAAKEKSGVEVKALRTAFKYNNQGAVLDKLYLETTRTVLQKHLEVHYPSLAAIKKDTRLLQLKMDIEQSTIGLQDVLVFAPMLEDQQLFKKYKNTNVKLEALAAGPLDNLYITKLYASGMTGTEVLVNGRLSGLPEPNNINYNLHIAKLKSNSHDVADLVPDSVLSQVRTPDNFGVTGQVAGTIKDYKTELFLVSSDGIAYVKGSLAMSAGKNRETYDMLVKTSALDLGHILKQDSVLGVVTALVSLKGHSFDVKTMKADIGGDISSAYIKGYRYHNVKVLGNVNQQKGNIDLSSADSNARIQLTGRTDFSGKYPGAVADIKIDSIDFQKLKLYSSELRVRGIIHADFPVLNPDYPEGKFIWWQPTITADGTRYYLDSLFITSKPTAETGQNITANLDALYAHITGKTPLTKIGPIILEHINRHYAFSRDSAHKIRVFA